MNGSKESTADSSASKPEVINVGRVIDESKLNRVSISVILLCGLIMLTDGYDYAIISVAAPMIMKEWNVSTALFGYVFSAAFFGYLIGAVVCGQLSDRIGRKKTLILGACIFSAGTLLVCFSHSLVSLIPLRVFAGIGIGGAVPCALTLTSEYSPLQGRGKYVSVMYTGFLIGYVLAGYIAGFMLERIGWRPLFLLGFLAPVISIIILMLGLPESVRWLSLRHKTDKQRETLIRILRKLQPDIRIDGNTRFTSGDSHQERHSAKELFSGRLEWVTPVIWTLYLISSIALFFVSSWSPQLLVVKGFTAGSAAYITGSTGILVAIGCFFSGFYFDRVGFRWGWALYVVAAVCLVFMGGLPPVGFVILLFTGTFFINFAHMDVTILAPILYPPSCRNQGAGTAIAVARIGAMIGPFVGGLLLATKLSMALLLALVSIPLCISAVLCYAAGKQYDFHFAPLYAGKFPVGNG